MNITTQTPAAPTTPQTAQTPFDPTVCFTCFGDYVEALLGIEQAEGPEVAFSAFKILADFCLYGIEPDPAANPWGWAWPMVEQKAKNSSNNRRRGFGVEDTEKTTAIKEYLAEHPGEPMRAVARAVGCSVGKVHRVVSGMRSNHTCDADSSSVAGSSCDAGSSLNHNLNISREHEREQLPPNSVLPPQAAKHLPPTSTHADGEGAAV